MHCWRLPDPAPTTRIRRLLTAQHTQGEGRQAAQPTLPCAELTDAATADKEDDQTRAEVLADEGRISTRTRSNEEGERGPHDCVQPPADTCDEEKHNLGRGTVTLSAVAAPPE